MNREQKRAWSLVISMSLATILCAAAVLMRCFGGPTKIFVFLAAAVQVTGVLVSFRFKPDKGAVVFDERDKQIQKNASMAGFAAAYFFLILASFAPIGILGEKASIPVTWLPFLLVGAGLCQAFAISVAILAQYGWKGEKS